MILLYNILQIIAIPFALLLVPYLWLFKYKKFQTLLTRCGRDLCAVPVQSQSGPIIWIHALSVGEVTSALPLVQGLQHRYRAATIIFSATTQSGLKLARNKLALSDARVIPFPLDILPVVNYFINTIKPDLFILVETDFWPNILNRLQSRSVPCVLVNGRISGKSMQSYRRYSWLSKILFNYFNVLCMQTQIDADGMKSLGIKSEKIKTVGNLKYTATAINRQSHGKRYNISADNLFIIGGSTHEGEEKILLKAFVTLLEDFPNLRLGIAPRNINRSHEIISLVESFSLSVDLFSKTQEDHTEVLIIDTIGDLSTLYLDAAIVFIGGSLFPHGGHNPLEAAICAKPILFGPHMDDFQEISTELVDNQGALIVPDLETLEAHMRSLLISPELRRFHGTQALSCIEKHNQILEDHLAIIKAYL